MKKVTVIEGDGIGPEVVQASIRIIEASGAKIDWDYQVAGKKAFESGVSSGVTPETVRSIEDSTVALKGPLETPVGYGERSANVSLRKLFETYANIRPSHHIPHVKTVFSDIPVDLIVIRENVEDLYAGIEYQQTPSVAQSLKLMSRLGCEKICRFAFEYAVAMDRKKVTCVTKANIMKLTEGLLKKVFEEIALDYPSIQAEHMIVDNSAHQLVVAPDQFDVIVASNMNGDILSDLTSGLVGGLGIASSANIGDNYAIFEAVHGSAPTIAGQNIANPTALISASVMMLRHLGCFEEAAKIEAALYETLKDGILTIDLAENGEFSYGTKEFADEVIKRLETAVPEAHHFKPFHIPKIDKKKQSEEALSDLSAVDIYIQSSNAIEEVVAGLEALIKDSELALSQIFNRGAQVYPQTRQVHDVIDHWQCRFVAKTDGVLNDAAINRCLALIGKEYSWMQIEKVFA